MKRYFIALILVFCCCFVVGGDDEKRLLPSEANEKIREELYVQYMKYKELSKKNPNQKYVDFDEVKRELAEKYFNVVQRTGLNDKENLELATLLSSAGKKQEALALYKKLDKGNSDTAYHASIRHINFFDKEGQYQVVEEMIKEHQQRFMPNPETTAMCTMPVMGLAGHYAKNENHSRVVELVLAEVNRVPEPLDAAYAAPRLLTDFATSFIAIGKRKELLSLMEDFAAKYAKKFEARKDEMPQGNSPKVRAARARINNFDNTVQKLQSGITQATLLGRPAPNFNFTHFFNSEPMTNLADLRGMVVMLDFWATWCGPCKAAFPFLRELYDENKDKGFVLLGVTSLQGNLYDGGIRKTNLEPEEEIELLKEFFVRHKVNWPNVFSDRGLRDPRYGIRGIPTLAVLDRKGIIHFVGSIGSSAGKIRLKELVLKLLAE